MLKGHDLLNKRKIQNFKNDVKRDVMLYILLILPMLYFIIFKYIPMYGVTVAFKDYNIFQGVFKSKWVGFSVFQEIFRMPEFYRSVSNTLMLNLLDTIFSFPAPIVLAILLNEIRIKWYKKVSQTLLYLPYFLSWIIVGGIVYQLLAPYNGVVNIIGKSLFNAKPIPFLTDKLYWVLTYVLVGIWHSAGWGTIIYLAAMAGINEELYEAAEVDGAGRLRKIWHITLPGIRATIIILLILNMGRIMSIGFERPFALGNALVVDFSDVISTFVYRIGLQSTRYSVATAVGLFQSVIGMIFLLVTNYIADKSGEQGIW